MTTRDATRRGSAPRQGEAGEPRLSRFCETCGRWKLEHLFRTLTPRNGYHPRPKIARDCIECEDNKIRRPA